MAKAKEKTYLNILDQLLDHGVSESESEDARKRGDALSALTQDMAEDGAFTQHISASFDSGRTVIAKKLSDDNILNDVTVSENQAKSNKDGLQNAANEKAVMSAIDTLLHQGHSPAKIAAVLEKYAELNLWNKQFSTDYLNRRANDLGMGYIQPNQFMPKKPVTYESQKPKVSHIALEGETLLGSDASKFGGQASVQRPAIEVKVANREERSAGTPMLARMPADQPVSIRTAADAQKTAAVHHRGSEFDSGTISEQRVAGKSFEQIWREACAKFGLHLASKAFHEYVSRAKQQGVKFASADVEFLREKLSFKGIEAATPAPKPLPRFAYDSGKQGGTAQDGNALLKEFELTNSAAPLDIELGEETPFDVEVGKPEINL
jgi:hypothetical protein